MLLLLLTSSIHVVGIGQFHHDGFIVFMTDSFSCQFHAVLVDWLSLKIVRFKSLHLWYSFIQEIIDSHIDCCKLCSFIYLCFYLLPVIHLFSKLSHTDIVHTTDTVWFDIKHLLTVFHFPMELVMLSLFCEFPDVQSVLFSYFWVCVDQVILYLYRKNIVTLY